MNTLTLGFLRGGLEIKQFLRSRESVVFTLAFPLLLLVIFGAIFNFDVEPGVPFRQYFAAGMIATGLLTTGFQSLAIQIPIEREKGILKRLRGTPMPRTAYFVGKVIMVIAIGAAETFVLLAAAALLYDLPLPSTAAKWFTFAWVAILGITACTLCGIAFSSLRAQRPGRGDPGGPGAAVHLRGVLPVHEHPGVDARHRVDLPAQVDVPGHAFGVPARLVRRPRGRRLLAARPDRAGPRRLDRGRPDPVPEHLPLDRSQLRLLKVAGRDRSPLPNDLQMAD